MPRPSLHRRCLRRVLGLAALSLASAGVRADGDELPDALTLMIVDAPLTAIVAHIDRVSELTVTLSAALAAEDRILRHQRLHGSPAAVLATLARHFELELVALGFDQWTLDRTREPGAVVDQDIADVVGSAGPEATSVRAAEPGTAPTALLEHSASRPLRHTPRIDLEDIPGFTGELPR